MSEEKGDEKKEKPEEDKPRPGRTVITYVFTEDQKRILANY